MLPQQVVIIGAALIFLGSLSYIRDTLRGKNKPNRVTWLMWGISPLVGAAIAWSEGATLWEGLPIFMSGFIPILILTSTFLNKQAYWKLTIFDYACGFFSILALVFWLFADQPAVAVLLAITGDVIAGLPTIRKSWIDPKSESLTLYFLGGIDKVLGLLILQSWAFIYSGFLLAVLAQNIIIICFVLFHKPKARLVDKNA